MDETRMNVESAAKPEQSGGGVRSVEHRLDTGMEQRDGTPGERSEEQEAARSEVIKEIQQQTAAAEKPQAADTSSIDLVHDIESILSDGLGETYTKLPPDTKVAFKRSGEEAARRIAVLLDKTRLSVRKIIAIIRDWLRILPGVNRHFINQEAKIRTDRLLQLHERRRWR